MRSEATARWAVQLTKFVADMRAADLQHVDLKAKNLTLVVSSGTPDGLGDDCLCLGFRPLPAARACDPSFFTTNVFHPPPV